MRPLEPGAPIVDVRGLRVAFRGASRPALDGVDLRVARGERVALVGPSGSGKSTLALALARLVAEETTSAISGSVVVAGTDLARAPAEDVRSLRGRVVGYVFQDPNASLDPVLRVEDQVAEAVSAHGPLPPGDDVRRRTRALLAEAELVPDEVARAWPHQLSGGMRQRVQIAMALAHRPALLVLDEPTTALDTVTQRAVLDTIEALRARHGFAVLLVTHDLDLAAARADRVVVLAGGRVVAQGGTEILRGEHASAVRRGGSVGAARAPVRLHARELRARHRGRSHDAVCGVDLELRGSCVTALVGASGAGKSTLVRALARLVESSRGEMRLTTGDGRVHAWSELTGEALRVLRPEVGLVFQDPGGSLDPRRSVRAHLEEVRRIRGGARDAQWLARALEEVGLGPEFLDRRPHELSGGERQRAAWARALALEPGVLLLDEPLSSVDPATRAHLLRVLARRVDAGLAVLLVTHDLGLVERFADDVLVMADGRVVESGDARRVLAGPRHGATRDLVAARMGTQA